jgi:hypothetical protein
MKNLNSFVLALHLISATLYLLIANFIQLELHFFYFVSESLFCGLAILYAQRNVYSYIHAAFIWLRGLIYALHYSGVYESNNVERLIFVGVISLIFVIIYYFYEHFHFKE